MARQVFGIISRRNRPCYLPEYIRYAVCWRRRGWKLELPPSTLGFGAAIALVAAAFVAEAGQGGPEMRLGIAAALSVIAIYALGAAIYALGALRLSLGREDRNVDAQVQLRREALQVAERLEEIIDARRLERDLSIEVSTLLEEAARNWHRARTALQSPYWRRADLAPALRAVREQSLLAVDEGMQELLVLFATSVPDNRGQWTFFEWLDEVLGQDYFATRGKNDHLSPFYEEGLGVAGKLRELADQVDETSRRLVSEQLILGAPRPGASLEATLGELRGIREAEEELRELRK